jgi:tellurium resistance protein TerD
MVQMIPGANAALTAENPGLSQVMVGLGWQIIPSRGPQAELVSIAILCDANGHALSSDHLVFFNQIESQDHSIRFDSSVSPGDDEQIDVDLSAVPREVAKIVFLVYVDPDVRGVRTFAAVREAHIRVTTVDNRELVRFVVPPDNNRTINAMVFGELYRHGSDWKFRAVGQGYTSGLAGVAADFRIGV